jgi:hypothetical protein
VFKKKSKLKKSCEIPEGELLPISPHRVLDIFKDPKIATSYEIQVLSKTYLELFSMIVESIEEEVIEAVGSGDIPLH